jgi:hypothetical protein
VAGGVRGRGLGRSLLFAVGAFLISNLGTATVNWLSQLAVTPIQTAAVSTVVGLGVVFFTLVLDSFKEPASVEVGPQPLYQPPHQPPYQGPQQARRPKGQRRIPWILVVVLVLGLCGVGFAATWGVQWLNGQAICLLDPKHYDGEQRLARSAAAASGKLAIEVTQVTVSRCGTIITVHAVNSGNDPLTLPVFGNASLTVPGHTSLGGDPRTSDWNETIPARGEMTGVLVFKEVPADATKITLSFAIVYGRLGGPGGVSVTIPLRSVVTEP